MTLRLKIHKLWLFLLSGIIFLAGILFSLFYLLESYSYLTTRYKGLNRCFYEKDLWVSKFFTPAAKEAGNILCLTAIFICFAGLTYLTRKLKNPVSRQRQYLMEIRISIVDLIYGLVLTAGCFGLWFWQQARVVPAFDEAFSAVNASGIHFFQCWTYYMLPNNHSPAGSYPLWHM
jgi:glucan phosphoethanolaminetransferase (alkaline phosphatase superfamily)